MNTTTQVAKYAGAGLAGIATSCVLAAPALAMRPVPDPGTPNPANARIADLWDGHTASPATATGTNPTPGGGVDWSNLTTALGGGLVLTGAIAVGATQLRRRQTRPA